MLEAEGISPKSRASFSDMYKPRSVLLLRRCELGPQERCVFCHWSVAMDNCVDTQGTEVLEKGDLQTSWERQMLWWHGTILGHLGDR